MSVKAASASARSASWLTTSMSLPITFSTRTPQTSSLRYGVLSGPSGNSGVWWYGGMVGGVTGAFMGRLAL